MNRRLRRALWILTTGAVGARLYTLGLARGFGVVAEATLLITSLSLAAWLAHVTVHEWGHFVAARREGFLVRQLRLGPVVFDFTPQAKRRVVLRFSLAGGVNSLPRGLDDLRGRLRRVALAGPLASALVTGAALAVWWRSGQTLASPLGVFVAMGALTLFTALLPGFALPQAPDSGTDLEQLVLTRPVLAHWVNAAAVQALLEGRALAQVLSREAWATLLPPVDGAVEPFELGWCVAALDAGERGVARTRLRSMVERFDDDAPEWLLADTFNQLGALAALEGDVVLAKTCLLRVTETQGHAWYSHLLEACIAKAEGQAIEPHLAAWHAGVETSPVKAVALAGNGWILRALA